MVQIYAQVSYYDIPYSRKFSPGENSRLFHPGALWAKIFRRIILPSENFVLYGTIISLKLYESFIIGSSLSGLIVILTKRVIYI